MAGLLSIVWNVNPVFFRLPVFGGLDIVYYAVSWMLAFAVGLYIFDKELKHEGLDPQKFDSIFFYIFFSTIIGARLGHILFYDPLSYLQDPIEILNIRGGGLASHGAAIGMWIGIWLFSRKMKIPTMWTLDRMGVLIPASGALVRIGNLMNSEIYGTETNLPWGFIFVRAGETVPKHPTQIYEALAYLLLFGLLLYMYFKKDMGKRRGVLFGTFLIGLFLSRFIIESIKNPQEAFEQGMSLNMGQLLSIPFILAGVVILVMAYREKNPFQGDPHAFDHLKLSTRKPGVTPKKSAK